MFRFALTFLWRAILRPILEVIGVYVGMLYFASLLLAGMPFFLLIAKWQETDNLIYALLAIVYAAPVVFVGCAAFADWCQRKAEEIRLEQRL